MIRSARPEQTLAERLKPSLQTFWGDEPGKLLARRFAGLVLFRRLL